MDVARVHVLNIMHCVMVFVWTCAVDIAELSELSNIISLQS